MRRAVVFAVLLLAACGDADRDRLTDEQATAEASGPETENFAEEVNEAEPAVPAEVAAANIVEEPVEKPAVDPNGPSFECAGLLSRVEDMICSSPELARLDRSVARTYDRAMTEGSSDQQERLTILGRRYLADRDRCPDSDCVLQAYRWYQRDIETLMGWPNR